MTFYITDYHNSDKVNGQLQVHYTSYYHTFPLVYLNNAGMQ